MLNTIPVGIGEIKVSRDPRDVLVAYGLGSCLGIGLYDPQARVAGLLHAVLPTCPDPEAASCLTGKYVDSGLAHMLEEMLEAGADRKRIILRMAGGANMLSSFNGDPALQIGARNISAAQEIIAGLKLKVAGQEVGGTSGRTVNFYVADGRMTIRMLGNREREI
ncbi:MAG: chemotaxis protein CheD [Chloroflexi bacterium]|jgi:chemotaxis protein CheD|nr:chemotaxis protein CheD [Chloroflexota bacterium]